MGNKIYASTGTFIGAANNFDCGVIKEKAPFIDCDGFELMLLSAWYDNFYDVIKKISSFDLSFPVVHFEKGIGILLAENTEESKEKAKKNFIMNVEAAKCVGAEKAVFHLWGGKLSDSAIDDSAKSVSDFYRECDKAGIELLIENIPARYNGPLACWEKVRAEYPSAKFIYDTRFGEFHGESRKIFGSSFWKSVHHIHISSFDGQMKEWGLLRPILHPGEGKIDFDSLISDMPPYDGTVTLESPVLLEDGSVDIDKLNRSLSYIRKKFCEKEKLSHGV